MYDQFEALNTVVVAVSQEDESLDNYGAFMAQLGPQPRFDVVADIGRKETLGYDRTTAYLIDTSGRVREIFPMIIHARPSWSIVLQELERLVAE